MKIMKVGFRAKNRKSWMKRHRRFLAIVIVLACVMTNNAYACDSQDETICCSDKSLDNKVYSPEFPDAYILTENKSTRLGNGKIQKEICATVFVEETISLIDGQAIITDSRLLSEAEVKEIGEDNFEDLSNAIRDLPTIPEETATRGKLTISFTAYSQTVGNGITINCGGTAHWSGLNFFYNSENNPAVGNDFFGIVWAGDYLETNHSFSVYWDTTPSIIPPTYYHPEPNSATVYEFTEYPRLGSYGFTYVRDADIAVTMHKNTLTGNGNLAGIIMQYTHTYETFTPNVSITISTFPLGFSVSSVAHQWTLETDTFAFPY